MLKKNWHEIVLLLLLLFHLVSNAVWLNLDTAPLAWDPAHHTLESIRLKDCILDLQNKGIVQCLRILDFYPPLTQFAIALTFIGFSPSTDQIQYSETIVFALVILFVYLWAKIFYNSKDIALATAVITSFIPPLFSNSRSLWLEIPMMLFIYTTLFFSCKSDRLSNKKYTKLMALAFGLGILTKWNIVVYLFVPMTIVFLQALVKNGYKEFSKIILLFTTVASILFVPWFLTNYKSFLFYSNLYTKPDFSEPQKIYELNNFLYYPQWLIKYQLGLVLTIVLIITAIPYLLRFERRKKIEILATIVFTYIFFSLLGNKDQRYMFAIIPMLASIISFSIFRFKKSVFYLLLIILSGFLVFQYFQFSYSLPIKGGGKIVYNIPLLGWVDLINLSKDFPAEPYYNNYKWPNEAIVTTLENISKGRQINVLILAEHAKLSSTNIKLINELRGNKNILINNTNFPFGYLNGFKTNDDLELFFSKLNYILVPENESTPDDYLFEGIYDEVQKYVFKNWDKFQMVEAYSLPEKELKDYLVERRVAGKIGARYEICSAKPCDKLFLLKINSHD